MRGCTIYKDPSDHPGCYVVRYWTAVGTDIVPDAEAVVFPLTDEALQIARRELIEQGMVWMGRYDHDDPVILETWL